MNKDLDQDVTELNSLLREGDTAAFRKVFGEYAGKLLHFTQRYLRSREDAEEVVQEVFLRLWEKRSSIRPDAPVSHLLFSIAHNTTLNVLRKRKNGQKAILGSGESAVSHQPVEDELILADYHQHAEAAISGLPPRRREIFLLSRHANLNYGEIASRLNISTKTVEVHMVQALKDIRRYLVRVGITL